MSPLTTQCSGGATHAADRGRSTQQLAFVNRWSYDDGKGVDFNHGTVTAGVGPTNCG